MLSLWLDVFPNAYTGKITCMYTVLDVDVMCYHLYSPKCIILVFLTEFKGAGTPKITRSAVYSYTWIDFGSMCTIKEVNIPFISCNVDEHVAFSVQSGLVSLKQ